MAKKGVYRKVVRIEIVEPGKSKFLKKGDVIEAHPVTANRWIADGIAKKSTKPLTNPTVLPSAKIKSSNED